MAKKATLSEVTNTYNNTPAINENLEALNDKFDNTLSRDGSTPNEMNADLDMNSNDILNVSDIRMTGVFTIDGVDINDKFDQASQDAASAAQDADDAEAFRDQAESFGNPIFNTIPLMAAYEDAVDGQTVSVYSGFNDEHEEFVFDADGVLTADGTLVVDGVGGGQWVSKRTVYISNTELTEDVRTFTEGTILYESGNFYTAKDSDGDFLNAGGQNIIYGVGNATRTRRARSWYVDPTGSDDNSGESAVSPFRTIQKAYDSLPDIIEHQQTIVLSDGIHKENYLDPTDPIRMPRPAVLFGRGKFISPRTDNDSGEMVAGVVIRSASMDKTLCKIETTSELKYGVYNSFGQIALQEVTLQAGLGFNTDGLLVSHRGTSYVHTFNVDILADSVHGNAPTLGTCTNMVYAESGGCVEITGTDWNILGGTVAFSLVTKNSQINTSGSGLVDYNTSMATGTGELRMSQSSGVTQPFMGANTTNGINGYNMSIHMRGQNASTLIQIDCPVRGENITLKATYVEFLKVIEPKTADVAMNACGFQTQINMYNMRLRLIGTNAYTGTNTANNSATPLRDMGGSSVIYEGTCDISGSSGARPTRQVTTFTASGNGETFTPTPGVKVYRMNGGGANRTGCTLGVDSKTMTGDEVYLYGDTWGIQITASSTCDIAGTPTIGSGSGAYAAAHFVFSSAGKWIGGPIGLAR